MDRPLGFRALLSGPFLARSTGTRCSCSREGAEPSVGFVLGFGFSFMSSFPHREEVGSLWPQAWPPGLNFSTVENGRWLPQQPSPRLRPALWLGRVCLSGRGHCAGRCCPLHPPACCHRPEALRRWKGSWVGREILGSLNSYIVWCD